MASPTSIGCSAKSIKSWFLFLSTLRVSPNSSDPSEATRIRKLLIDSYGMDKKVPILTLRQSESADIREFADFVYKNVFEGYTLKQWGASSGGSKLKRDVTRSGSDRSR